MNKIEEEFLVREAAYVSKLKSVGTPREAFDPTNKKHLKDYAYFVQHSNWKDGCNYILEPPFEDIPSMINSKLINHFLAKYMQ